METQEHTSERKASMSAGEIFRTARQERNLSVEEVSQRTKIRPRIIEAIERDDFAALPAAYMGSFVKTYAQFLNLTHLPEIPNLPSSAIQPAVNKEQVLAAQRTHGVHSYNGLNGATTTNSAAGSDAVEQGSPSDRRRKKNARQHQSYNLASNQRPQWLQNLYITVLALIMLGGVVLFWKKTFAPEPEAEPRETQARTEQKSGAKPLNIAEEAASAKVLVITGKTADMATMQPALASDSLILEAKAIESAWINVVMDRKRSEQLTLEAGKTYRWSAERLITLQLGNAGGVQFRRNGVPMEPLGKSGAVVRNVAITRDVVSSSSSPALVQRLMAAAPAVTTAPATSLPNTVTNAAATSVATNGATVNSAAGKSGDTAIKRIFKPRAQAKAKIIEPVTRPILPPEVKPQVEKLKMTQQVTPVERRN